MEKWQGYTGPFDNLKEEIIRIFEERAGLSPKMSYMPKIANVSPYFYNGQEFFSCDMYRMHGIGGEIEGIKFKIDFGSAWGRGFVFTQDPGRPPHFHFHSISRIQIPGKILDLFLGYPKYYVYTGEGSIEPHEFLNLMIHHQRKSPLVLAYEPRTSDIRYYSKVLHVQTKLVLVRQSNLESFPKELPFEKLYREWEFFFRHLIDVLKSGPVMTKHIVK
ncbi:MAG: hypothetical protein QG620_539 [Patescibacteria group bacterium]|nr:hypothetical protein [Patescibacteria group bacterium]